MDTRQIPLSGKRGQGKFAIVDESDFEWLSKLKWRICPAGRYAVSNMNRKVVLMHRLIMSAGDGEIFDHKNRNGLDNRRNNLRKCSQAENQHNQGPRTTRSGIPVTSQYKGVYRDKRKSQLWRAMIGLNGRRIHLGGFSSEIEAAKAYDAAARYYFGEFAHTNFEGEEARSLDEIRGTPISVPTSKYLGVHLRESNRWAAAIIINGKKYHQGTFDDEIEAARAFDRAAKKYRGEKARLNFPD